MLPDHISGLALVRGSDDGSVHSPNSLKLPERNFGPQDGLQNAPRSAQDGSKRLLKSNFFALENRLKFGLVLGPILVDFGSQNGAP